MKDDFLEDLIEKTRIAAGAHHRGGQCKRLARLPSDNLTNAQLAKLSGPVHTYRMTPDVTPDELATWPADIQKMWREKFGGDAK